MTPKNEGHHSAFPINSTSTHAVGCRSHEQGLTMRDYFAAKALQAMNLKDNGKYSQVDRENRLPTEEARWVAQAAYRYADAMLEARKDKL